MPKKADPGNRVATDFFLMGNEGNNSKVDNLFIFELRSIQN